MVIFNFLKIAEEGGGGGGAGRGRSDRSSHFLSVIIVWCLCTCIIVSNTVLASKSDHVCIPFSC